jgi:formyltetrahydrofolate synthetase
MMAALALVNGADEVAARRDLRARVGRIVLGRRRRGQVVTADDVGGAGAAAVLLRNALKPNLVQTCENTPAFVHTGSLGNLHHGSSSILADRLALRLNDYVITETAFGSDVGLDKFINIKCRISGVGPNAIIVVATLRALKMHGGVSKVQAGKPLPDDLYKENLQALDRGGANLAKHIENACLIGVPVVVAVNRFARDTDREIARVEQIAREAGAQGTYASDVHEKGGAGAIGLAQAIVHTTRQPSSFKLLYPDSLPLRDKLERIVTQMYGGAGVEFSGTAQDKLDLYSEWGYNDLPVCIAKTHLSLSHEEKQKGRPKNFRVPIKDLRLAAGAGYVVALCGDIGTMPGLPRTPSASGIDFDEQGQVTGLE